MEAWAIFLWLHKCLNHLTLHTKHPQRLKEAAQVANLCSKGETWQNDSSELWSNYQSPHNSSHSQSCKTLKEYSKSLLTQCTWKRRINKWCPGSLKIPTKLCPGMTYTLTNKMCRVTTKTENSHKKPVMRT